MAYNYVLSADHNIYSNITVYERYNGDSFSGWEIRANEWYVFYDTTANNVELDQETGDERPIIYYYSRAIKPRNYNWGNFHYFAVLRDSVAENYIFGGGNKKCYSRK